MHNGSTHIGIGKKILQALDWQSLQPFPAGVNQPADAENIFRPYCTRTADDLRVIYFFNAIRNVELQQLNQGQNYRYTFINPLNGEHDLSGNFVASEKGTWEVPREPIKQDWVLVVQPE